MGSPRPPRYGLPLRCFDLCRLSCRREWNEKRIKSLQSRQRKCHARLAMREHLWNVYDMTVTARRAGKRGTSSITARAITGARKRRVLDGAGEKWKIMPWLTTLRFRNGQVLHGGKR